MRGRGSGKGGRAVEQGLKRHVNNARRGGRLVRLLLGALGGFRAGNCIFWG